MRERIGDRPDGGAAYAVGSTPEMLNRLDRIFPAKDDRAEVVLDFDAAMCGSRHRVIATPRLREWFQIKGPPWLPSSLLIDLRDWLGHLWLIPFTLRHRSAELIVVKGFRTSLLLVAMLGLRPFRKRLLFIVHHNLQFAHTRALGWTFKLLCRLGAQLAFLEGDEGLVELGIEKNDRQFVVLPLPLPVATSGLLEMRRRRLDRPLEIGIIGRDLREKNTDELLQHLLRLQCAGQLPGRLFLASDNAGLLATWADKGIPTVGTRNYGNYLAALARADVVIFNYARHFYFYRSSGVINDAASLGTAVVCPDYPIFRRQVTEPARIGSLFATEKDILPALHEALHIVRLESGNFDLWARARSAAEFSRRIDEFVDRRGQP